MEAAERDLLDLPDASARLRQTTFYVSQERCSNATARTPREAHMATNRPASSGRAKIYGKNPDFGPLTVKIRTKTAISP